MYQKNWKKKKDQKGCNFRGVARFQEDWPPTKILSLLNVEAIQILQRAASHLEGKIAMQGSLKAFGLEDGGVLGQNHHPSQFEELDLLQ